jgi:hypothetical protein
MDALSRPKFHRVARFLTGLIGVLMLASSMGCQFAPKDKPFKWPWTKDDSKPLPDRILPVWTESVLHQPNQPGVRGFGGRIYFYAKDDTDPIEIDGNLAVYVFDADDVEVTSQKPLRKFMFTADQFSSHMSKTSIGPSYSIWLPWGEIGGPPRRLSLIARFEGREGGTTISDPTIKLLPGVPSKEHSDEDQALAKKQNYATPFRLSGHKKKYQAKSGNEEADENEESSEEETDDPGQGIKTIDLPPSFQRHLRGASGDSTRLESPPTTPPSRDGSTAQSSETPPPSADLKTVQAKGETTSAEVAAISPVTTEVYDYRTRKRPGPTALGAAKNDIRQGRWIESIERD